MGTYRSGRVVRSERRGDRARQRRNADPSRHGGQAASVGMTALGTKQKQAQQRQFGDWPSCGGQAFPGQGCRLEGGGTTTTLRQGCRPKGTALQRRCGNGDGKVDVNSNGDGANREIGAPAAGGRSQGKDAAWKAALRNNPGARLPP
jgi:hypothetical protein